MESFTVITTEPNDQIRALHNRMPVILQREDVDAWLDPKSDGEKLSSPMAPAADGHLSMYKGRHPRW